MLTHLVHRHRHLKGLLALLHFLLLTLVQAILLVVETVLNLFHVGFGLFHLSFALLDALSLLSDLVAQAASAAHLEEELAVDEDVNACDD